MGYAGLFNCFSSLGQNYTWLKPVEQGGIQGRIQGVASKAGADQGVALVARKTVRLSDRSFLAVSLSLFCIIF